MGITVKLKRYTALIISGAAGVGKTQLARKLAGAEGPFTIIRWHEFCNPFSLGGALDRFDTIIVDDCTLTPEQLDTFEEFVTSERVELHSRGKSVQLVIPPHLIICTQANITPGHDMKGWANAVVLV